MSLVSSVQKSRMLLKVTTGGRLRGQETVPGVEGHGGQHLHPQDWQYLCRHLSVCCGHHHTLGLVSERKVVILLDALHCLGEWDEEGLPIIHGDKHRAPLIPHQLWNVHLLKSTATYCGLHLRLETGSLRDFCFNRPKHQSGANLV